MFCDRCEAFWFEALSKAEIPETIKVCQDVGWKYHETILHHSIRELERASDLRCRLCRIIYSLPTNHEHNLLLKDRNEALDIVLSIDPSNGPHPVLSAEFRDLAGNGNIRISKRMVASCSGLLEDADLAATLHNSVVLANDSTGSDGALELAAYWTQTCISSHEKCRSQKPGAKTSFVPTRLLDVSNDKVRLIETKHEIAEGADRNFVALSHCWGLVPIIRTLKGNYAEHRTGIAASALSKTFREAVYTTRKLGYRYIWIDSLCIKQDDGDDWAAEAATMCDVYQHATLTIAAAHAPGGDVGCFAERDGLLHLPLVVELPHAAGSTPTRLSFTCYGRGKELGGGDPALYGRAWVLQEQLLSPRMLIFDGTQVKWECLTLHGSESSPKSGTTRYSLYYKFIRSGIMEEFEYFSHADATDTKDRQFWARMKLQYWCDLVMDYTHRGMTKSKDRLVALAGVGTALGRHTDSRYLAGLWSEYFAIGLLWSIEHNKKFTLSAVKGFDIEGNERIRHENNIAPSWSWASVTAPVMFEATELLSYDRICNIINVSVSGSIDAQTGRAEIRGHIRRGYVNPVYPYSIREAAARYPHMTSVPPAGNLGREEINFKDRLFHPNDWFLFSEKPPSAGGGSADSSAERLTTHGDFRLVRGSFKPDEIIDPAQEITFLAIVQRHAGAQLTTRLLSHQDNDPLRVHSLALIPTGKVEGEYKRVGLAVWEECAWYGYLCGWKDPRDRIVERPGRWSESGRWKKEGAWHKLGRKLWWDDLEFYDETKKGSHVHQYEADCLPDLERYHANVDVEKTVIVVV